MFFNTPLPFIQAFVKDVNMALQSVDPVEKLSKTQQFWIGFCLLGIVMTNTISWKKFERFSLGRYTQQALSWMFLKSCIDWNLLLQASLMSVLSKYEITKGVLLIDELDKQRSKNSFRLHHLHKVKDKKTGGYFKGQCLVFLVLVTPLITVPVGFSFYKPDPVMTQWRKDRKASKKKKGPKKPTPDHRYPTKIRLGLALLKEFRAKHFQVKVQCVLADALYGTASFMDEASALFGGTQVITQLRYNQNIRYKGKLRSLKEYFTKINPGVSQTLKIRGGKIVDVKISSSRLYVSAHKKKRFVIALKYEGEEEYRYLVASDLSWRTMDIVQTYTLRFLIEVFFQDWKSYEGWGQLAKQPGEDGSSRSVTLSLLLDHCLLTHHEFFAKVKKKLPAPTVGSLIDKIKVEGLTDWAWQWVKDKDNEEETRQFLERASEFFPLRDSTKHMSARDMGTLGPAKSLQYKNVA